MHLLIISIFERCSCFTPLRCGGILNHFFVADLLLSPLVKEFWKSVNIWRSLAKLASVDCPVFWLTKYICNKWCWFPRNVWQKQT